MAAITAQELKLAFALVIALFVGTAIMVVFLTKALQALATSHMLVQMLFDRRQVLERALKNVPSLIDVAAIAEITHRLARDQPPHIASAMADDLEALELARLAVARGDPARAAEFLERIPLDANALLAKLATKAVHPR